MIYVIGGLYGNPLALEAIETLAAEEAAQGLRVELVFNGDFNWFNIDSATFEAVNRKVLQHRFVLGNVEWELANPQPGAGCGCGYPDSVNAGVVERSNRIIEELKQVAGGFSQLCAQWRNQPRYRCLDLNGRRILILHGDPESLAGWGLSLENLRRPAHQHQLQRWLDACGADVIASTHTCLPALWRRDGRCIVNNGSAGMGNFVGDPRGSISRISTGSRHPRAVLSQDIDDLRIELVAVPFNSQSWLDLFGHWWPSGSDAAVSYGERIRLGTALKPTECLLLATNDLN